MSDATSISSKTIEDFFCDWESQAFGYGYGTGEEHTLKVLKNLSDAVEWNESGDNYTYDYQKIEKMLGEQQTWLLINILCGNGDIEYGSSPRYGWFYGRGKNLINFLKQHTVGELYDMTSRDSGYSHCFSDYCSCGYEQLHQRCKNNPFWNDNNNFELIGMAKESL